MAKVTQVFDPLDAALVRTDEEEWIQSGEGNEFKVLRISKETGAWSALIRAKKGQVNPRIPIWGRPTFTLSRAVLTIGADLRERETGSTNRPAPFMRRPRTRLIRSTWPTSMVRSASMMPRAISPRSWTGG